MVQLLVEEALVTRLDVEDARAARAAAEEAAIADARRRADDALRRVRGQQQ